MTQQGAQDIPAWRVLEAAREALTRRTEAERCNRDDWADRYAWRSYVDALMWGRLRLDGPHAVACQIHTPWEGTAAEILDSAANLIDGWNFDEGRIDTRGAWEVLTWGPVARARTLGMAAYAAGHMRAPAADAGVMQLLAGLPVGAGGGAIMGAFCAGFDAAADAAAADILAGRA